MSLSDWVYTTPRAGLKFISHVLNVSKGLDEHLEQGLNARVNVLFLQHHFSISLSLMNN